MEKGPEKPAEKKKLKKGEYILKGTWKNKEDHETPQKNTKPRKKGINPKFQTLPKRNSRTVFRA